MELQGPPLIPPDSVTLSRVQVRPIRPQERARWDELMATHHYLGFRHMPGESVRYVAEHGGDWLALLGWASAAFKCGPRDRWIGWSPDQQWKRLSFVACNQRFLVLPHAHVPNLASRVLSLNLRRLSQDWMTFHGHTVVLAETFVDPTRFSGTCYRAAGWVELGQTRGYGRNAGQYYHHGQTKMVFVYPLVKKVQSVLASAFPSPRLRTGASAIVDLNDIRLEGPSGLIEVLRSVKDPRKRRGIRHTQLSILVVAVCAALAGCRSFVAMAEWAADLSQDILERLGCRYCFNTGRYVAPSEPTLRRTIQSVDADDVDRRVGTWLAGRTESAAIAIDGKTLRGSTKGTAKAVHLLGALQHGTCVVVGQQKVSDKSNEITAAQPLLESMELTGRVVTADAMHTQIDLARFLVDEKQADYVFTVKGNQPTLEKAINDMDQGLFSPSTRNVQQGPWPDRNKKDLDQFDAS